MFVYAVELISRGNLEKLIEVGRKRKRFIKLKVVGRTGIKLNFTPPQAALFVSV